MTNIASRLRTEEHSEAWLRERLDYMTQFITEERKEVLNRTVESRTHYMRILTENMFHPQNASAIMRHCEAFGIQQIHTVEDRCKFDPSVNIVRGTEKWVDVEHHETTAEALAALKAEGYRIVATTPHRCSATPESFDVTKGKFVLVFGTEHAGISEEVIAAADDFLMIPMCGMVESLNVSASAAILIYMLSERIRQQVEGWQLSDYDKLKLLTRWTMSSVRDFEGILRRAERNGKLSVEY
ncbi:MAG: RNA methyltransferase [Alistipes sp.]|nr:RNA methyltransferase [Alistipes sp.]MBQ3249475.1 RNA methyltransferase [Alistipes sp.]